MIALDRNNHCNTLCGDLGINEHGIHETWKVTRNKQTNTFSGTRNKTPSSFCDSCQIQHCDITLSLNSAEAFRYYLVLCSAEEADEIIDLPKIKRICSSQAGQT
jgi:hypothetical protein